VIARSEFQIQIASPAEHTGAEDGVRELERAIGRAKALGHDHGAMEKQLVKAREGVRRFRERHPEVRGHGARPQGAAENEETGVGEAMEITEEARRSGGQVSLPIAWNEAPGVSDLGYTPAVDSQANVPANGGAASPLTSEGDGVSGVVLTAPIGLTGSGWEGEPAQENSGRLLTDTAGPGGPDVVPAVNASAVPGGEDSGTPWNADLFRREFEGMLRALLEEQDSLRARAEASEVEHEQGAARQAEIETRLREAEARLRFNRDAG
jgi:hypothetical protein